jgi:hypothetical protein
MFLSALFVRSFLHYLLIVISSIAAGQNTTFFLAKPNAKLSDLPRHPVDVHPSPECMVCGIDEGDDDDALQCDKVSTVFIVQI